jgi:hypothetical protein
MFTHIFASYIMLYPCFILIFGDLPMIPFILVITLQGRKTLFSMFLMFQDLYGVKRTSTFGNVIFYPREASGAQGPHGMGQEAQKSP